MLLTEAQASLIAWGIGAAVILAGAALGYWLRRTGRPGGGIAERLGPGDRSPAESTRMELHWLYW